MPTLEDIEAQIEALPNKYIFFTRKEIKRLPNILNEGEEVRALTSGYSEGNTVLAVCTNRRVIFLDSGMFFGQRQRQVQLDRVQSILGNYVILFGSLSISDGSSNMAMRFVLAKTIDPFVKAVHNAMDEYRRILVQETAGVYQSANDVEYVTDVATQLERLAALRQKGVLTEQEFLVQKQKILNA